MELRKIANTPPLDRCQCSYIPPYIGFAIRKIPSSFPLYIPCELEDFRALLLLQAQAVGEASCEV